MKYALEHCIGSRIRRLSRVADNYIRRFISGFDITENQMTILFCLHELGKVEQGEVGRVLLLERSSVSRSVRLLEKQGLVQKNSAYRPEIELTKAGVKLVQQLIPHWEKAMDILVGQLGIEGLSHLEKLEKQLK